MTRKARHQIQQKHFKNVMFHINEMQVEGFLSDLKLKCEDKEFSVHKLILSASCPFFQEYFITNPESQSLEINFMNSKILETVLLFIYEGRIDVIKEEKPFLKDLVEAFRILQIPLMCNYCLELLFDCHSPEQLLSKWNLGEELRSDLVLQTYLEYLHKNLETLQTKENFLEITFDKFNSLLSNPVDEQEDKIISAILLWVKYNELERASKLNELLKYMNFGKLSKQELFKLLDEPLLKDSLDFNQTVVNFFRHQLTKENSSQLLRTEDLSKHVNKTPKKKDAQNVEKGKCYDGINQQKRQAKKKFAEKLQLEKRNVIQQRIIAYDNQEYKGVIEYDFNSKTWSELKDESLLKCIRRCTGFATCSFGNYIYFFGGASSDGVVMNLCFVLDLLDNEITEIPSMKFKRYRAKAVKLHHFIYVIGGYFDKKCSQFPNADERYNILTQQWETVKQLSCSNITSGPHVVTIGNCVYSFNENILYWYSPEKNNFSSKELPFNFNNFYPSAMIEESGNIIIFGYGSNELFTYDVKNWKWSTSVLPGKEIFPTDVTTFSKTDKVEFFVVGHKQCFLYTPPDSFEYISTLPFKHPKLLVIEN